MNVYNLDDAGLSKVGNASVDAVLGMALKDGVISSETAATMARYRVVYSDRKTRLFSSLYDWLWPETSGESCLAVVFVKETQPVTHKSSTEP